MKNNQDQFKDYRNKWKLAGHGLYSPDYPIDVTIELAGICNGRCVYCPVTPNYKKLESIFPIGIMKEYLFKKIIDEIEGKTLSVKFQYRGESTLHPQFNDFCDYVSKKDFIERMINTNGNYIKEKREGLYKLDKLIFSIDSLNKELFETQRANLSFDLLIENFAHAYECYKIHGKPKLKVNCTLTKQNFNEQESFKKFFPQDVEIRFAPGFARTESAQNYVLDNLKIIGRKNCRYPGQRLIITWQGKAVPCCAEWAVEKSDIIIGDVIKNSIHHIWHSKERTKIRDCALKSNYKEYKACQNCNVWPSYKTNKPELFENLY